MVDKVKETSKIMDSIKRRKIRRGLKKVGVSSNVKDRPGYAPGTKNPNYDPRMGTSKKQDFKKNPLKVGKMSTPNRKLAKDENKISRADMIKGMPDDAGNKRKKKARRNAAGTMGQMASGGKVKKMMGGGMAMKYKHGGKVGKKCPRDGIAMKGRTKA